MILVHMCGHSFCSHFGLHWVFTMSRLLKVIGLLCRISSVVQGSFAKETYNSKEPTNRILVFTGWALRRPALYLSDHELFAGDTQIEEEEQETMHDDAQGGVGCQGCEEPMWIV